LPDDADQAPIHKKHRPSPCSSQRHYLIEIADKSIAAGDRQCQNCHRHAGLNDDRSLMTNWQMSGHLAWVNGLLLVIAIVASAGLVMVLRPFLVRYVMAKPNQRSSHKVATPQGGGIAVIAATVVTVLGALLFAPEIAHAPCTLLILIAATIGLAIVGVSDDIKPLDAAPRLLLQAIAVAIVIAILPHEMRAVSFLPWWLERALMLVAGVWFVNLVNFMDGIDWMTVGEVVPVTIGLAIAAALGVLPPEGGVVTVALCGAMLGFAPFNKPVAKIFLGDVGSLPIGLLLFWLLLLLAGSGHLAAAVLLPLYYLADTTITLLRRLIAGETITQAHRRHYYQRALDGGLTVTTIIARIVTVNAGLVVLATSSVLASSLIVDGLTLVAGFALVGLLLYRLNAST
jgi:UDP-N-acetylmuramyl pentapeptide phosphotransferase/UDP-N-acetylglucosamine-1-phosphate transferase